MFKAFVLSLLVVCAFGYEHTYDYHQHEKAPLDHYGQVIDTPEVAYLKQKHLAAVHEATHQNLVAKHEPYVHVEYEHVPVVVPKHEYYDVHGGHYRGGV